VVDLVSPGDRLIDQVRIVDVTFAQFDSRHRGKVSGPSTIPDEGGNAKTTRGEPPGQVSSRGTRSPPSPAQSFESGRSSFLSSGLRLRIHPGRSIRAPDDSHR
jgi:hypothetical protein